MTTTQTNFILRTTIRFGREALTLAASFVFALALSPATAAAQSATITASNISGTDVILVGTNLHNPTEVTVGELILTGVTADAGCRLSPAHCRPR